MLLKNIRFYYCFIKFYHKSSAIATTIFENLLKREISGNPRLFFTSRLYLTPIFASARYFACAQYDNQWLESRGGNSATTCFKSSFKVRREQAPALRQVLRVPLKFRPRLAFILLRFENQQYVGFISKLGKAREDLRLR